MRTSLRLALSLVPLAGWLQAQAPPPSTQLQGAASGEDPVLATLIQKGLAMNPDLAQARVLVDAERERAPQAQALPDPTLSLGIQNDGLKKIEVGQMDTSYYQIMVTQPLPWPGKRALRAEVATLGSKSAEQATARARLTVEADIRRAYTGLQLVRTQLGLLDQQAGFLAQAESTARSRYEVGQGSQADLLRAQLERTRTAQARSRLQSQERAQQAALNRVLGQAPDTPVPTGWSLSQVPDPAPVPADFQAQAEAESPELHAAKLGTEQAQRSLDLARLDRHPDFTVSAGYMPRGGLDPMWTASVGITLPVWQKHKQQRAVAEQEDRRRASDWEVEKVRCLLQQRIQERSAEMDSALQVLKLYRDGLLVQSEATFRATLAQFTVGRQPFLAVLEALDGWVADQSGQAQAQAQAQAVRIALLELNLGPTPQINAAALPSGALGSQAMGGPSAGAAKAGPAPAAGGDSSSSMSSM